MSYEGLARKYRPQAFADVVGQTHVVQTLSRAIESGRWAPAYLFIGGRGLGKTTLARILAKSINCVKGPTTKPCLKCEVCEEIASGRDLDVLEIDAASHTGVDNIRDVIIQSVATAPARARAKIYIIDETHMLSTAAFNALLKTLEEPPPNVVFILATTEGHKVPSTIRSRCQRFDFRPATPADLTARLASVAAKEKMKVDAEALDRIVEHAEGGIRDALSALDLAASFADGPVTAEVVEQSLGLAPRAVVRELMELFSSGDASTVLEKSDALVASGMDILELEKGLLNGFRAALRADVAGKPGRLSRGRIVRSMELLVGGIDRARAARFPRLEWEILATRLAALDTEERLLREIHAKIVGAGGVSEAPVESATPGASVEAASPPDAGLPSLADLGESLPIRARAFLKEARLLASGPDRFRLVFREDFHRENFSKFLPDLEKILCAHLDRPVRLRLEAEESSDVPAKPAAAGREAPAPGRAAAEDPVERLKKIFNAEVIEVIEKKPR